MLLQQLRVDSVVRQTDSTVAVQKQDAAGRRRVSFRNEHVDASTVDLTATDDDAGVEAWLHIDMPRVGSEYPQLPALNTRLVRLTTGRTRLLLFIAGGLCLMIGLFMPTRSETTIEARDDEQEDEEEAIDEATEIDAHDDDAFDDEVDAEDQEWEEDDAILAEFDDESDDDETTA